MPDIIGSIGTAINVSKQLLDLAAVAKNAEAKLLIAELQLQLADVKSQLAALVDDRTRLEKEVKRLASATTEVVVKDGLYYKENGDGPFCTACYDSKGKLIRVTEMGAVFQDMAKWACNVCHAHYGGRL